MPSISLKDRRAAVVQLLDLALGAEEEALDEGDSEMMAEVVEMLTNRRRGRLPNNVTSLPRRRRNLEEPIGAPRAANMVSYAIDCVATVAQPDNPRLAAAFRELRQELVRKSSRGSAVAPPPPPSPWASPATDVPD